MGTLYIVATPIGNLEDMTFRAVRILKEARLIAAEDTRTSRVLTQHFEIDTPLTSYHEHNKLRKLDAIFDALAAGDVALISDAGTPGISDPGYELIQETIQRGFEIVPIPGANAIITALVASGMATDRFVYHGFLPRKSASRLDYLQAIKHETMTMVFYESPHRIVETLADVARVLGAERQICVAREMTKKFEQFWRGTAQAAHEHFSSENPKGEVTLIIGGASGPGEWDEEQVRKALKQKLADGESLSRAAKAIAALSGWKKGAVYALGLEE